ncbi:reticulophagy regulator 3 [Patella vulgata]|uniref:reticulophagy regulator 3 n=1 Tax=Patella vulgata TaxID=6465 RepID=UPI0024A94033|nr:reticulophagy regulator 3 [Patella vulgata]
MNPHDQEDVDRNVKLKEKWVAETLSPVEPMVMSLQSLLVWEDPKKSALLFTAVHISFWFLAYISSKFYFLISVSLLVIVFVDTWKKKIWPEIRVPPPVPEDEDDWTPVHTRLLSTPEISHHIAQALSFIQVTLRKWRLFRRNHPQKFSFFTCSFFTTLYLVSRCISGLTLSYTLVMSILLWPCVVYHDLFKKVYLYMEPLLMWLDYQLKHLKIAKVGVKEEVKEEVVPVSDEPTATISNDVEEEFYPDYDPLTTAALAKAITDSEDECGTPSVPTPGLSKEPSIDNDSDDERGANLDDLMPSIDQMPSFDDLDNTDDEWSPGSPSERTGNIHFTPTHFGDSDSDDEDQFGDMSIPDGDENSITHKLVSQTLTNMMENALQGLNPDQGSSSFSSGMLPHSGAKITYTKTSQGESVDISDPADDTIIEEDEEDESTDAENIEKEFDFLDDYDQDDAPKKK